MPSKWVNHVKAYAKKHNVTYMCAISDASKTYKKKAVVKKAVKKKVIKKKTVKKKMIKKKAVKPKVKEVDCLQNLVDSLVNDAFPVISLDQCEETRSKAERIRKLADSKKFLVDNFIIGILGASLNNKIIDKHGIVLYVDLIKTITDNVGGVNTYPKWVVKKTWMKMKHVKALSLLLSKQ